MRQIVDRGLPLEGIQTAVRDSRVPYVFPRALQNVNLRDKRIRRRGGMEVYSSDRVTGQQLAKHTANSLHGINDFEARVQHFNFFRSPLSYGLLRWNEDYQPRKTKGLLVEFILTVGEIEELVISPYTRLSRSTYGASGQVEIRGSEGVYVYDQTVLANHLDVLIDGFVYGVRPNGVGSYADVFPLTALAVAFTYNTLTVKFDLWNSTDSAYELGNEITYSMPGYQSGNSHAVSVAMVNDTIALIVDGEIKDSFTLAADQHYVGEYDAVNGMDTPLQRDIVLLNECTARGGYQSTCVPVKNVGTLAADHGYYTFRSDNSGTDQRVEPWAASPPAGTGLTELRYWQVASVAEAVTIASNNLQRRLTTFDDALLSYFRLDSGFGYDRDRINESRPLTVHHNTAAIVDDQALLTGKGIHFADGQHLIQSFGPRDGENLISPIHSTLTKMFGPAEAALSTGIYSSGEFTFEMQIRTPAYFGQEINKQDGAINLTGVKSDTRQGLEYAKEFGIITGYGGGSGLQYIRDEDGTAIATNEMRWHRSFDQTLFSVEGAAYRLESADNNWWDNRRVPMVRGLLTPEGKVAFEVYSYNNSQHVREFRVVSTTVLTEGTVYTLGFRRRMIYAYDPTLLYQRIYGFSLDIYINGVLDRSLSITDATAGAPASDISSAGLTSFLNVSEGITDIIIGASQVNNGFDASITEPNADSASPLHYATAQRFMSPRQDQPGFFTLGFFRLWHRALSDADFGLFANKKAPSDSHGLVYDLAIENSAGSEFFDQGPYSTKWTSGYKGWGYPQADNVIVGAGGSIYGLQTGWFVEDCLGYQPIGDPVSVGTAFQNKGLALPCSGLSFHSPTLSNTFGLLAAFGGFARYDSAATGAFENLRSPGYGLLSNYHRSGRWQGINIGDRTVLTSPSGYPKIYNGRHILPLGFRNYNGGRILADVSTGSGTLTPAKYYGVRIFYFSERSNVYHFSEQSVVFTRGTANTITLSNIPQHPDPRVTSIIIGLTTAQETRSLALGAPVYAQSNYHPNRMIERVVLTEEDVTAILDTNYTQAPHGTTAASYNGRLWIAGDINLPDLLFYSDPGNPEAFDTLTNRLVLEEGSGDRIVALKAMFGALYAFKANSIWRIDEVALGQFQLTRIAAIGPASEYSLEVITIPDTGRTAVMFWSGHGPYLFDEVNLQYLGFAVEQEKLGFNYVKHESVFTVHDVENRQVLFFYQVPGGSDRYISALVYNYRQNTWTTDTGRPGYVGLSVDLTKRSFGSVLDSNRYTLDYLGLVGGDNGVIYKLSNTTEHDGYDYDEEYDFEVTGYNDGELIISWALLDPPPADTLNGLWLTLTTQDRKEWVQVPILRNEDSSIYLDLTDVSLPFVPIAGGRALMGLAPVAVEFPWDMLDVPYFDKQIHRVTFWATNNFNYAMKHSWRDSDPLVWKDVTATSGKRIHVESPARSGESFKMFVQTLAKDFRFDGFVYIVEPTNDAAFKQ
jgi:hypothetical protein